MDDGQLFNTLMEIKESGARQEALLSSHIKNFEQHVEDDKVMAATVTTLSANYQQQRGMAKLATIISTAIGSAIGIVATYFIGKPHG